MSSDVVKKCRNCDFQVDPDYTGSCPNCGKQVGYQISVTINEVVKVSDVVKSYQESMKDAIVDAFKKYDGLEKKFKDNKIALNNINILKNSLRSQEDELIKKAEKDARKKVTKTKTFTIDAIIGTEEQRREYIERNVKSEIKAESKKTANDLLEELLVKQTVTNVGIQKIHDRLSPRQTILFGLGIGVLGSIIGGFIVVMVTGDPSHVPVGMLTNMTNATQP